MITEEFLDKLLENKALFGELSVWAGNLGETYVQYVSAKKALNKIPLELSAIKKRSVVSIEDQKQFIHSVVNIEKRFDISKKKLLRDLNNTIKFIDEIITSAKKNPDIFAK